MTRKRILLAAAMAAALPGSFARADGYTPTIAQDQANRLSIFHDYGFDVIGDSTGNSTGVGGNGGGFLGNVPLIGTPGEGSATAIIDRFSFLDGLRSKDASPVAREFDVSLGYTSGYDSNAEARRVPADKDASFVGGTFRAGFHVTDGDRDPIVGAPLQADFAFATTGVWYEGTVANADAVQPMAAVNVRDSLLGNAVVLRGSLNDQFTIEHGAAFLDTFDATGSGEAFALPQLSVEAGYDFAHLQYFFHPILDAQKPTADRNTVDARLHLYPLDQRRGATIPKVDGVSQFFREALTRATVGYAHVWNDPTQTTGSDYKYDSDRAYVGLEGLTLPKGVKLFGSSIGTRDGGQPCSTATSSRGSPTRTRPARRPSSFGLPGHRRRDNLDVFTIRSNSPPVRPRPQPRHDRLVPPVRPRPRRVQRRPPPLQRVRLQQRHPIPVLNGTDRRAGRRRASDAAARSGRGRLVRRTSLVAVRPFGSTAGILSRVRILSQAAGRFPKPEVIATAFRPHRWKSIGFR